MRFVQAMEGVEGDRIGLDMLARLGQAGQEEKRRGLSEN
jgi:hypothetical protein